MAETSAGRLFLVPNTLDFGLPEDQWVDLQTVLPPQVLQVAARLDHWVAESAKTTRAFLKRVDRLVPLTRPLQQIAITELPRPAKGRPAAAPADWSRLLAPAMAGHDLGLISEAGLPAVADPGAELVQAAHAAALEVVPMSGPSSLILAVAASGLNGQSFAFVGYLPVEAGSRSKALKELETHSRRWRQTQLVIETPYRNPALFEALLRELNPATRLSVSCGLSLAQGWTRTRSVAQWRIAPAALPADVPAVFAFLAG
jgi:16S rRNA (cytidine1402-2'-O)-methyltransferase